MFRLLQTRTHSPSSDQALRAGNFSLLPTNPSPPIVVSQPSGNVKQQTWISMVLGSDIVYQRAVTTGGVLKVVEGTELSWHTVVADPSNLANISNPAGLTFSWRRDEVPLVALNNLNQYRGSRSILITSASCTPASSGKYVCEIRNRFGVVQTDPLALEVIKLKRHPLLYTNLLLNGDADSQLDGWTSDSDIISTRFSNTLMLDNNFSSLPGASIWYFEPWEYGPGGNTAVPQEFRFSQGGYGYTFHSLMQPWVNSQTGVDWREVDPAWMHNPRGVEDETLLPGWHQWVLFGVPPQIVANEDQKDFNGFFPGMEWIDRYNLNLGVGSIGLYAESKSNNLSYFTRDKIKFTKYGGKISSKMTQTVDLSGLADVIDGNVIGVNHATSQFFAYIGAGISRYQLRMTTIDGEQTFNWNVVSTEDFATWLDHRLGLNQSIKKILVPNTVIDIIPLVEDITTIQLNYLDELGELISTDSIKGPDALDVFAIKETAYLPLSLQPLFEFVVASGNPIRVFGQTYTTTDALQALFANATPYPINGVSNTPQNLAANVVVQDSKASFMLRKFGFQRWGALWPNHTLAKPNRNRRGLVDRGAAAMFAVERTKPIPRRARSVQINVIMEHTSDVIVDQDPKVKSWDEQTIYFDNFNQDQGNSRRVCEYGHPRSGITKMKFVVTPNNFTIESDTISYKLPPPEYTVVGLRKQRLSQDVHNSADGGPFNIEHISPVVPPAYVGGSSPFITLQQAQDLITQQQILNDQVDEILGDQGEDTSAEDLEALEAGE